MTVTLRPGDALHQQIARVLRARIESGGLGPDGAVATEQQLCVEFGASRSTIRMALEHLKALGLLHSRKGVGTRSVASVMPQRVVRSSGDPLHAGLHARARVVQLGPLPSGPAVAAFFGIAVGEPVWHFVRLYRIGTDPLSVVDSYLPLELGIGFARGDLKRPMNELLWSRHRIRLHRSVHAVRIGRADVAAARLLAIALADPVLRIQSSVYLEDGRPIRWTENQFREDRYEYVAHMRWPDPDAARGHGAPARPVKLASVRAATR